MYLNREIQHGQAAGFSKSPRHLVALCTAQGASMYFAGPQRLAGMPLVVQLKRGPVADFLCVGKTDPLSAARVIPISDRPAPDMAAHQPASVSRILCHDLRNFRFRRGNRQRLASLGAAKVRTQAQDSRRAKSASHPHPKSLAPYRGEQVVLSSQRASPTENFRGVTMWSGPLL